MSALAVSQAGGMATSSTETPEGMLSGSSVTLNRMRTDSALPLWRLPAEIASRLDAFEHLSFDSLHPDRQSVQDRKALSLLAPLGTSGKAAWSRYRSNVLLVEHRLADKPLPSMPVDVMQLVLLNQQELSTLARLCGLALLAPAIRLTVAREGVAKLKQLLGERHYQFAIHEAPFRCHSADAKLIDSPESLQSAILPLGWAVLNAAVCEATADPAVVERFSLKLPPALAAQNGAYQDCRDDESAATGKVPLQADESLALANALLLYLDSQWLSSFSALR